VLLGLGYALAVLVLGQLAGRDRNSLAVAGATLAVAAQTIQAFSGRLRQQVDLGTLSDELCMVVDQTMEPGSVSLWLRARPTRESVS